MDTKTILNEFARVFERKIDKDYYIKIQFEITDEENSVWQVDVKDGKVSVYNEEKIVPEKTYTLTKETLCKLYNNELNTYTAILHSPNEKIWGLIDLKDKSEKNRADSFDVTSEFYNFLCRFTKFYDFFSKDYPTKIIVDNKNGVRHTNNIYAIALHSKMGKSIVHIYFSIKKNEEMYQPPFEFSLYVLSGKGTITIDDEKFNICAKEYYHITPRKGILIGNQSEELLEILYLSDGYGWT